MGKRSASSRLRRNAALSLSISVLFVGILVFLLHLLPEKPAQPDFAPSSVVSDKAASTSLENAPSEPRQVENEGPDKGETGEKAEVVSLPEPGPPMLLGKVTGEGGGIERASIILFSTKRLEELIDKLQDLAPQGGNAGHPCPDLERPLGA